MVKQMNYKTTTITDLMNDAIARGEEAKNTLKNLVNMTVLDDEGNESGLSFIRIKREYFKLFCPELLPAAKAKKPTMKELVMAM